MTDERTPTPRVDASPLACDATATGELAMSTPLIARGDTAVQAPTLTGRAPADDVPESPARIGRFVVLGRLGEGGMGTVFSAYDNDLDRKVAIKLVRPTLRERFGSRARVLREAQAMARISHPNVVQIYEVGEYERLVYVAMEFVKGETLGAWIERGGPRSRQELLDAFIAAARGLAAAHAAGVVHRDFKPDNVLIGEDGRVLVVDFGIARAPAEGERDASATRQPPSGGSVLATPLTATGALMGTPAYMSPEQYRGAAVDARADQFSLCVTLYEALHGQRPFAGDTVSDLMTSVLTGALREPPRERRAPEWLLQVLRRGLSVEPGERFPDMEALIDALLRDPARARLALARRLALALGVVALLGGALWWTIRWRAEARRADAARIEARRHEALARAEEARAQGERDAAYQQARIDATRARDIARVLAADDQLHDPTAATALLLDVEDPGRASGFSAVAVRTLQEPIARAVLDEHGDQVMFVAFSPDGRQLATASFDGTTRISPTDGEGPSLVLRGHEDRIYTAAFSRDGARLVTASRDRTARVWELAAAVDDAVPATVLEGHRDIVWHADFAPDGERVVTGSRDETVGVWEVPRGPSPSVIFTPLAGHGHIVWCVEVSSDGAHVVSAGGDGTARVWSLADLDAPPQVLGGHTAVIYQASFDAAGERVITASADGTARVYWVGEDRPPLVLADHTRPVERAVFSPDGEHALTASLDGTARLWTLTGAVSSRVLQHTEGVESVAFSPDGQLAATGSRDRTVGLWRVADGVRVHALRGHTREVFRVRFSPDSQRLASGSFDGTARVWELDALPRSRRYAVHDGIIRGLFETPGGAALTTADDGLARLTRLASARDPLRDRDGVIKTFAGATLATYPAALSPDGAWLLVGAADGRVRLYPFDDDARASPTQPSATAVMGAPLRTVAISPDGQLAAAADNDGRAHVWRLAELAAGRARPLAALPLPDRASGQVYTNALIFTRDGAELITVGHGGVNRSWSIEQILAGDRELAPAREEDGHARTIRGATLSPDGRLLASYSSDRTARVWNLETGAVQVLEGHVGEVTRLSFDGDGRRVVTASNDGTARVWILGEDASPVVLGDRLGETRDARFSPGGARVATATDAGLVQLWSAEGGDPITLPGHVGAVSELLFVDDGEHLLSAGEDGALRLWYVGAEDDDAAALARRLARRTTACLTAEQRARLLGERPELAAQRRDACARRHGRR